MDSRSRGVSEIISFVLVFGLIASTVGIVYVTGFSGLENARDAERLENAERAYDVLADNMADIYHGNAPSRKTEIKLSDSQLTLAQPTTFTVTIEDVTDGAGNRLVYESNTRPLVFTLTDGPDTAIVYENGGVFRTERDGGVIVRDPPFLITEERTVIPYVTLTSSSGTESMGGDSTVLVRATKKGRNVLVQDTDTDVRVTLTIETDTERAPVWSRYINRRANWAGSDWKDGDNVPCETTDPTSGDGRKTVTCTLEPNEFYLTSTGIETTISA